MAARGKLDPAAVSLVAGNLVECWTAATAEGAATRT